MSAVRVVFPVRADSKAPAIKDWRNRSRPMWDWMDPAQENPQWLGHTRWGAPAGPENGWWVLDVDPRHGGNESLISLAEAYGGLPPTFTVRTPSGGLHFYWRWVAGCERITNTAGKLGPGLDIRAEGGMVLVPPTPGYEVLQGGIVSDAPTWLLALLMPAAKVTAAPAAGSDGEEPIRRPRDHFARALQAAIEEIQAAPTGSKDVTMNRNAYGVGRLVEPAGQDPEKVIEVLIDAAISAGYDPSRALDCITRAVRDGMRQPRAVAAVTAPAVVASHAGDTGDQTVPPEATTLRPCPPKPGPQPVDLTTDAGLRWIKRDDEYREWQRDVRDVLRARLVVIEYDQTRVLHERVGLRRVMVLGTEHKQAGHIIAIGRRHGFLIAPGQASAFADEFLKQDADEVVREHPSLWDTGAGLYRWEGPAPAAGSTETWDTLLARMTDPEAFLAHVWSIFEPRYTGRQVLWFQGGGNDGKSIAMTALIRAAKVPSQTVSDNDLGKDSSQFLYSSLWDKPLVMVNESKNVNVLMSGTVHKLSGRDLVPVEYKHGQRFTAQFQGVVFVTSNGLPQVEKTRSNLSRLTIIRISKLETFIPGLQAKLEAEVPALLHRAREIYAQRCRDHFRIDLNETAQADVEAATGYEDETHATMLFGAGYALGGDLFISRKDLMTRLLAAGAKLDPNRTSSFYRWLAEQPGIDDLRQGKDRVRGFSGLKRAEP